MGNRFVRLAAALAAAAVASGCGMTGHVPDEPSQQSGKVSIGDKSEPTKTVTCSQNEWALTIDATTQSGRAHAFLQLGGEKPIVKTVTIENLDGLYGVAGGESDKAEATSKNSSNYTITGTASVSGAGLAGQTQSLPFTIDVPC
jgi:ipoprotein LpqH